MESTFAVEAVLLVMLAHGFGDIDIFLGDLTLPLTYRVPELIIDNSQFGYLADQPFALRVDARDALAGRRILDVAQPVPNQAADI